MKEPIATKLYKAYAYKIYPHVKHLRGFSRPKFLLDQLSVRSIENISEEETKNVLEYDWDNLIILDACRADLYNRKYGGSSRYSVGSCSAEFIERTFSDTQLPDTIYISANPYLHESRFVEQTGKTPDEVFFDTKNLFLTDWDENHRTVLPEKVVKRTKEVENNHPDKRKIIHFMQPHHPFIDANLEDIGLTPPQKQKEGEKIWNLAEKGQYTQEQLWEAYERNLEIVMEHVEELKTFLSGRTMITSDHGNLIGENGRYGHPGSGREKPLRHVPVEIHGEKKETAVEIDDIDI